MLKTFLFGNKVPLPDAVKRSMKEYQKEGEWTDHFFCKVRTNEGDYYEIIYRGVQNSRGFVKLIIRADGSIPHIDEICQDNFEDVVWIANCTDGSSLFISRTGRKWSKYTVTPYTRIIKLLSRIQGDCWDEMSEDIKEAWQAYYQVAEVYIYEQKVIRECYRNGTKIRKRLFQTHITTLEDCRILERNRKKMVRSAYYQNHVQLKTYEDRKKLLRYLFSHTRWYQLRVWITVLELLHHHSRLLNEKKLTEEDRMEIENNHEKLMDENARMFEGDIDFYKELRLILRNPDGMDENKK
ncbi:hypothetical protein NXZ84_04850 [Mechercharimyces sp. CAU 1602]|nr:hypothetical protein [Mechercharimyces sp. CAU 1602]